jgi:hypothetical protein
MVRNGDSETEKLRATLVFRISIVKKPKTEVGRCMP